MGRLLPENHHEDFPMARFSACCLGVATLALLIGAAAAQRNVPVTAQIAPAIDADEPVAATFSIVAADPESGICGAAVASKYPAVGKVVPSVRAGVGAFVTQAQLNPK